MQRITKTGLWQGAVGAAVVAVVTVALPAAYRVPWLAGLLWLTVGIYLGMALMGPTKHLGTEAVGGAPVLALALLGTVGSPWWLVAGWLAHPVWDLLHSAGHVKTRIHPVTVPFCIVFDVAVAALVVALAVL